MRTIRLQRTSKLVSNMSKEGEEDSAQVEQLSKISLKSRTNCNENADEGIACTNRKLQSVRSNLPAYRKWALVESLPFSSRDESEMNQASHLRKPTFISSALSGQKQDQIKLLGSMHDIRKLHNGHHHCSSHCFCCSSSMCISCVHNIRHSSLIEEFEKLKMKDNKLQGRRLCRSISNGAPFVICSECFELLQLPIYFFVSKRGSNKVRCGACSKMLLLQFPAKDCSITKNFADSKSCPKLFRSSHSVGNASLEPRNSLQARNCEQKLLPPLHQLMGYFSASEVLYQVTDVGEASDSSEPAMPDSYRCYEEERHKNLLLHYSEDEAYFGSVEVKVDDSSKILSKREQSHIRSLMNGIKIKTRGSKIRG